MASALKMAKSGDCVASEIGEWRVANSEWRLELVLTLLATRYSPFAIRLFGRDPVGARIFDERVVRDRHDRREIAVGDPFGPRKFGDVVGDRAQREIDDLAWIRRNIRRRGVHQVSVEHQHRTRPSG